MKAVLAAEMATAAKYEAKIKLLLASADGAAPAKAETAAPSSSAETKLYDTRSANVAAAAKAGKSRWGDKEVAKVQIKKGADLDVKSEPAADAVNGKANGVSVAAPSPINLPGSSLYDTRNKSVAAAGKAGKSRWGDAEVKRATEETLKPALSSSAPAPEAPGAAAPAAPVDKTPEIEAADHGLRNDGGVGGPSLAERVNLGQQLFTASDAAAAEAPIAVVNIVPSAYDLRNAKIAAAAAAGKSRWGSMENSKATVLAAESSSKTLGAATAAVATEPMIQVSPEVEAADHGLRNDGGVGGPSLAERVNLGSGLF